jgi:hypothetical protein
MARDRQVIASSHREPASDATDALRRAIRVGPRLRSPAYPWKEVNESSSCV